MAKTRSTAATDASVEKIKEKVDLEPRVQELENRLERMHMVQEDTNRSTEELVELVTELHGKIEQSGIPLPPEVLDLLKGKEAFFWIAIFHALVVGAVNSNPVIIGNPRHLREQIRNSFKHMDIFTEVLREKVSLGEDT